MWVKILIINCQERKLCETSYKQWIQEYKIDGFRWDLTKGFTQKLYRLAMKIALTDISKIE
jgi:pullulanase/glycogen debranching enzyme